MTRKRALIVGAGGFSRQWAKVLSAHPEVALVGWVSRRRESVVEAAAELGLHDIVMETDLLGAIGRAKPDFVVDVTPPEAHHFVTLTALGAGVAVLGEKPMAASLAQARAMVAASERAGKLYMVSQSRRYHPGLRALRGLVAEHVGALGLLASDFFIGAHFGGFRDAMPSPLLLDMAIHTFDAARYISQADPVAVYCDEYNPEWSWYAGNASATAIFEMTGGLRYTYRGSWCAEGAHTSWESAWRAVGPRGTALWDGHGMPEAAVVRAPDGFHSRTERVAASAAPAELSGLAGALADFMRALDTGATPMGECHDNIKSLAMVFAAVESAERRQRVKVAV
ncbi:MAG TPA: Gfo/Idh/MocA family oxidoreductase [Polyangiaceae bacterium]|nr:Gfo/Idh/MocA family oxidoreductase [Polyangiaceae bacterium]